MNGAFYFTFSSLTEAVRGVRPPNMELLIWDSYVWEQIGKKLQYSRVISGAYFIFSILFYYLR